MRETTIAGSHKRLAEFIAAGTTPKCRSNSRQAFRVPRRGERIKAETIRKHAVDDGYKFETEEAYRRYIAQRARKASGTNA